MLTDFFYLFTNTFQFFRVEKVKRVAPFMIGIISGLYMTGMGKILKNQYRDTIDTRYLALENRYTRYYEYLALKYCDTR